MSAYTRTIPGEAAGPLLAPDGLPPDKHWCQVSPGWPTKSGVPNHRRSSRRALPSLEVLAREAALLFVRKSRAGLQQQSGPLRWTAEPSATGPRSLSDRQDTEPQDRWLRPLGVVCGTRAARG